VLAGWLSKPENQRKVDSLLGSQEFKALESDRRFERGADSIKAHLRIYPLAQATNPPQTNFVNVSGKAFNTIHSMDFSYFDEVNQVIQEEPISASDPETLGLLASIGIEHGKPFAPDERMKKVLTECFLSPECRLTMATDAASSRSLQQSLSGLR
jgi:hypothetical protein